MPAEGGPLGGKEQGCLADAMQKSCISRTSLLPTGRLVGLSVGYVAGHCCLGAARLAPHTHLIRKFLGKRVALLLRKFRQPHLVQQATAETATPSARRNQRSVIPPKAMQGRTE